MAQSVVVSSDRISSVLDQLLDDAVDLVPVVAAQSLLEVRRSELVEHGLALVPPI
jgi:hypothetical protein